MTSPFIFSIAGGIVQVDIEVKRLTNRHIAKLLDQLDEVGTTTIVKEAVKRQMWLLSNDLENYLAGSQKYDERLRFPEIQR